MDPNASSMQKIYAAPKDWEANRETIARLYLEENRTLQEVMDYMASRHTFFATWVSNVLDCCVRWKLTLFCQSQNVQNPNPAVGHR